jgi:hypothetical protein
MLRLELDGTRLVLERTKPDLALACLINDQTSHDVQRLQRRMRNAELEHALQRKMLERDRGNRWRLRNRGLFLGRTGAWR